MSRCDYGQFFFTDKKHISLRIPGNAIFSSGKNNFTASYKAILSLRYAYYNLSSKSDWYYLASDDTYVVVENMCQYLATLNPNNPYFVAVTESESSDTTATDDDDAIEYIVSRAALHRLVEEETVDCSSSSDKSFDLTRSSIAIGNKEVNGDIGIAPPAKLMYNMIYHCDAERLAELHVQNCDGKMSPSTARPGFTENIHILDGVWRTDLMGAAQNAVSTWWSELAKHGIRSDMLYTRKISRRKRKRLSSFSKMAWWNNVFIGCAIQACDDFYFTSCMYGPGGNIVDAKIYEIGAPCSGCGPTCNPEAGLCTWNKSIVD
ncbi:hypothetical protein Y032_0220g2499 [Ancylostoma ceylanicum]|uniref:SCP domain-containing protein n=1 Tax=Ancylostoma ceylanicum TaxID=53326 RepID=A0A016SID6_9BILA|nr:hypothetical protein Y032_0220g2499 [Ancylostoma ceylanicum]